MDHLLVTSALCKEFSETLPGGSQSISLDLTVSGPTWVYLPWQSSENTYTLSWEKVGSECPGGVRGGQTIVDSRIGGYNITGLDEDTMYVVGVASSEGSSVTLTASTLETGEREYSTQESNSETPLIVTLIREKKETFCEVSSLLEWYFWWEARMSLWVGKGVCLSSVDPSCKVSRKYNTFSLY